MTLKQIGSNQTEITKTDSNGVYIFILFSYNTPVAAMIAGKLYRTSKHHSMTTSKHINAWLAGCSPAETKPQEWFDAL